MNVSNPTEETVTVDEKRAKYERFEMTVLDGEGSGYVNVRNTSYSEGDHTYSVEVRNGETVGCSCPHATHRGAHCKHQIAVEQSPIVVSSVSATSTTSTERVATDGGCVETDTENSADPCDECGEDMSGQFLAPAGPNADVCIMCDDGEEETDETPASGPVINTATGWGTNSYRPPEDEDEEIDDTPL